MHVVSFSLSKILKKEKKPSFFPLLLFFFKILFIYLFDRDRQPARGGTGRVGEEEAGSHQSREPDVGLSPRALGSCPEPKADT